MSKIKEPPIYQPLIDIPQDIAEKFGDCKATLPWILFFNQLFVGDTGTSWTPTFQNLTEVGTATYDAVYYKISGNLTYFRVTITPSTSISGTGGTTYIDNFPLDITADGAVSTVSGGLGTLDGMAVAANDRIYPATFTTVTVPLTICGTVEAR